MKNYFTVSRAAEIVGMTAETLRHYDRIGLVRPRVTDEFTGYRYYSEQEIVKLNTVKALRCMDMRLSEIKDILSYDDFGKIVEQLKKAERSADGKIAELSHAKERIRRARVFYEEKLRGERQTENIFVRRFPERVILLSDNLQEPTLDNLWNYHRHFYGQLDDGIKDKFAFEDIAGVYEKNGETRLFAVCLKHAETAGLVTLPEGDWLCADCDGENLAMTARKALETAKNNYGAVPSFTLRMIVLSGILQWNYQVQIYLG